MPKQWLLIALWVSLFSGGFAVAADNREPETIRIAAASSLQFAVNEIIDVYIKQSGSKTPQVVYGSSGNLFRQIMQGAPFDVFLSADIELINKLQTAGKTQALAAEFGTDQLVLYSKEIQTPDIEEFRSLLAQPESAGIKIAIANPRHAPFGRAAQQALESLELWELALPRLVFAEKVSQAAQFAVSGAAEFSVISRSLALSPALTESGSFTVIPSGDYQPVVQSMALVTSAKEARILFDFISESTAAATVLRKFGLR